MTSPGLGIGIPREVTDTAYPWEILREDPMLIAGSLMLVDPAHPANPWAAGVPIDGASLPNLAWQEAKALIPAGTQTTLGATLEKTTLAASAARFERSGKGGLHAAFSASYAPTLGQGLAIRPKQLIADYLAANPTHAYFFSVWFRGTRFGNANGSTLAFDLRAANSISEGFIHLADGGTVPATKRTGSRRSITALRPADNAGVTPPFTSPVIMNAAVSGYEGTPTQTGAAAQQRMKLFAVGYKDPFGMVAADLPSRLFYRAYLEDLTVSGRNYATVDALDFAEYTKQVLTAQGPANLFGGRYYGDTYTDPATIS